MWMANNRPASSRAGPRAASLPRVQIFLESTDLLAVRANCGLPKASHTPCRHARFARRMNQRFLYGADAMDSNTYLANAGIRELQLLVIAIASILLML
jgi:hypothetical protein